MLLPVLGSNLRNGPRTVARFLRRALFGTALLSALLPSVALAQDADDGGWFNDPPVAEDAPQPVYDDPQPQAAPAPQPSQVDDSDPSALTTFKPALDPYGAWVADSNYGTVWVPRREVVGEDFAPYVSRGHWALTADDDWIWVSDYPFGWAVFHYGRWVWISGSGWAWVPGRTYANAWVVWRTPSPGYAYVGWAPMPPAWGYWNGYAVGLWYSPPLPYVFCPSVYAFDYRVHYHIVHDRYLVHDIASHTRTYPTPYHAPASPGVHTAGSPAPRAPIGASSVPRGPRMSAAGIPAQSIPAARTAPPPNAMRLSGPNTGRITATSDIATRQRFAPEARARSSAAPRPSDPRPFIPRDAVRRPPASSSDWPSARSSVPSPSAPRSSPSRVRVSPSMSRSFAPPSHNIAPVRSMAPVRSVAPIRSFSPSMPRMHGGGGSFRRR